jgi:hypothetical protein
MAYYQGNNEMKMLLLLSALGALIGGIPGAAPAFFFAVASRSGEVGCCLVNLALSIGGACIGMLLSNAIAGRERFRVVDVVVPVLFGLLCGFAGYTWLYWALSHADPPL